MTTAKRKLAPLLRVRDLLMDAVGGMEEARSVHELHASDLTRQDPLFCPREVVLLRLLQRERPPQYVQHAMRVTWDEGRDKQWRINNDYLRDHMVGDWRCTKCGDRSVWSTYPDDRGCEGWRGHHHWEYQEPVFTHPSGFTGSVDGVVRFKPARLRMLEVKIMKADDFRDLRAPLAEHRVRTQLYLRMVAEADDPRSAEIDVSEAHILYVMRGHGSKDHNGTITPFREFVVHRDDAAAEHYVRMAKAVRKGVPELLCSSAMTTRAKKCPVAKECFSGKYPPTAKWRGA